MHEMAEPSSVAQLGRCKEAIDGYTLWRKRVNRRVRRGPQRTLENLSALSAFSAVKSVLRALRFNLL